ncbi:DUF1501 domain-containing protein [Thermopirellula anaerolimosa]
MASLSRRTLLQSGLASAVVLGGDMPGFLRRAIAQERLSPSSDDTLVVAVQLAGGNDGLNTIVPYENDIYLRNRPTLSLKKKDVIPFQDGIGINAHMKGVFQLMEQGKLAVIHAVGYPHPNGDHNRAMEIWQTADPDNPDPETGWLGRAADHLVQSQVSGTSPIPATAPSVFISEIATPLTVIGRASVCVKAADPTSLTLDSTFGSPAADEHSQGKAPETPDSVVNAGIAASYRAAERIADALREARSGNTSYPDTLFARRLDFIARLIRADLGTRIFCTEMGGSGPGSFDTHSLQANNHSELLGELSAGLATFVEDLARDRLLDRVIIYTYSEFGRTIRENGRRGTDHGAAAPMFLVGGGLRQTVLGEQPDLAEMENGGVKHSVDFRQVYATILERKLGIPSQDVLGTSFEPLPILG